MNLAVRQAASLLNSKHLCIPEFNDCLNSSDLTAEKTELFSSESAFIPRKNEEPADVFALFSGAGAKV
jgi:hypothetical protein